MQSTSPRDPKPVNTSPAPLWRVVPTVPTLRRGYHASTSFLEHASNDVFGVHWDTEPAVEHIPDTCGLVIERRRDRTQYLASLAEALRRYRQGEDGCADRGQWPLWVPGEIPPDATPIPGLGAKVFHFRTESDASQRFGLAEDGQQWRLNDEALLERFDSRHCERATAM